MSFAVFQIHTSRNLGENSSAPPQSTRDTTYVVTAQAGTETYYAGAARNFFGETLVRLGFNDLLETAGGAVNIPANTKMSFDLGDGIEHAEMSLEEWASKLKPEDHPDNEPWILYTTNPDLWDALVIEENGEEELDEEDENLYAVAIKRPCPCKGEIPAAWSDLQNRCPICNGEGIVVRWLDATPAENGDIVVSGEEVEETFSILDSYKHLLEAGYHLDPRVVPTDQPEA